MSYYKAIEHCTQRFRNVDAARAVRLSLGFVLCKTGSSESTPVKSPALGTGWVVVSELASLTPLTLWRFVGELHTHAHDTCSPQKRTEQFRENITIS